MEALVELFNRYPVIAGGVTENKVIIHFILPDGHVAELILAVDS